MHIVSFASLANGANAFQASQPNETKLNHRRRERALYALPLS
jgi:hypothetical protein